MLSHTLGPCGCGGGPTRHSLASAGVAATAAAAPSMARREMLGRERPRSGCMSVLPLLFDRPRQSIAHWRWGKSGSLLRHGAAPAGQVPRIRALAQLQRALQRPVEIVLDQLALDAPAQKIRPQELGIRRGVLGETAGASS